MQIFKHKLLRIFTWNRKTVFTIITYFFAEYNSLNNSYLSGRVRLIAHNLCLYSTKAYKVPTYLYQTHKASSGL